MNKYWISMALAALAAVLLLFGILRMIDVARSQSLNPCFTIKERDRVREITFKAIDGALYDHVMHLFLIWTKDPSDQPKRASVGMSIGLDAHRRAMNQALAWNPNICSE